VSLSLFFGRNSLQQKIVVRGEVFARCVYSLTTKLKTKVYLMCVEPAIQVYSVWLLLQCLCVQHYKKWFFLDTNCATCAFHTKGHVIWSIHPYLFGCCLSVCWYGYWLIFYWRRVNFTIYFKGWFLAFEEAKAHALVRAAIWLAESTGGVTNNAIVYMWK
jgi:hypothetical protein